jgi:hypothetical protein
VRASRTTVTLTIALALLAAPGACQSLDVACFDCADAAADRAADAVFDAPPDAGRGDADGGLHLGDATADVTFDAAADAGADAATDATPDADGRGEAGEAGCPVALGGPPLVLVVAGGQAFCVDRTEVTNADYALFLAADAAALPAAPPTCAWKASHVPGASSWPPASGTEAFPVIAVDWCDAFAYCAWAGKRLCGRIGGGALAPADFADAAASQWFAACSRSGVRAYPYGDVYDNTACNGADFPDADVLRAAGSLPTCVGGYPGLLDMSGNVFEWEDACTGDAGASDACRIRGGGYFSFRASLACAADVTFARSSNGFSDVGFRCCSP